MLIASVLFAFLPLAGPSIQDVAPVAAAVEIESGGFLLTRDSKRVGKIDRVRRVDGRPVLVAVMFNSRIIMVPVASLSNTEKGLVTSLSRAELLRL